MKQRVRVVTTKDGLKSIMKLLNHYKDARLKREFINENTCKIYGDLVFLKWNRTNYSQFLTTIVTVLMSSRASYSIAIFKDNLINTKREILYKDENKNIPNPVIICRISDEKTEKLLKERMKNKEK